MYLPLGWIVEEAKGTLVTNCSLLALFIAVFLREQEKMASHQSNLYALLRLGIKSNIIGDAPSVHKFSSCSKLHSRDKLESPVHPSQQDKTLLHLEVYDITNQTQGLVHIV